MSTEEKPKIKPTKQNLVDLVLERAIVAARLEEQRLKKELDELVATFKQSQWAELIPLSSKAQETYGAQHPYNTYHRDDHSHVDVRVNVVIPYDKMPQWFKDTQKKIDALVCKQTRNNARLAQLRETGRSSKAIATLIGKKLEGTPEGKQVLALVDKLAIELEVGG